MYQILIVENKIEYENTFQDDIITIIVPDLHARVDFLPNLLDLKLNINDKQITV